MLIPISIAAVGLGIYEHRLILPVILFVAIYAIISISSYITLQKRCISSLMDLATQIENSQKEFIEKMPIPYAVVDNDGKIMWSNNCFEHLVGGSVNGVTGITSIFKEIHKSALKKHGDNYVTEIHYNNGIFQAVFDKINETDSITEDIELYAFMLFDETEKTRLHEQLEAQKLVVANISVDNFEEILEEVDDVKSSLLQAVLERKIRKYFGEADAIIRKIEKDRYFLVFPNKFLDKLKEDKFSVLEDIKNTKIGNELQFTVSIGMGLNGDGFTKNAEYAKTAANLALGRGGSQVVIKDGGEVSIYGIKGKEFTKNTRVKARIKAQALKELMSVRDRVIVMGHTIGDADCLGAAIGIACAAKNLGKPVNIVINTITKSLRPLMESFINDGESPDDLFINSAQAMEIVDKNTLIVVVDTNRPTNTECPELLNKNDAVVVFDHHRQGTDIIADPILSYIEPYASSTCEMVAEILQYFSEDIRISPKEADSLYAGMIIDTSNFMTKTGVRTFEAAAYLKRMGAEAGRVRMLLREDINAYRARAEIVRQAVVYRDAFAISVCNTSELESPTVVGAQAANELLNIVGIKASFVLTEFNGKIYISSRSIDEIDVQSMMEKLGGGGHLNIAGAQIENSSIDTVSDKIRDIIDSTIEEGLIK